MSIANFFQQFIVFSYCNGIWVNRNSLTAFLEKSKSDLSIAESFQAILDSDVEETARKCPKCNNRFLIACYVEDTELDFCTYCKGLFFDEGELESVFNIKNEPSDIAQCGTIENVYWSIIRGLGIGK